MGDDLFAVKWRNMKMHFMATESTHSPVIKKIHLPQLFDIKNDPKEAYELWGNKGYTHGWVMEPIMKKIVALKTSMAKYRNIKLGEEFKGY